MSSELLIVISGFIFSTMLTVVSFESIPSSFWQLPFLIIVLGIFAVFIAWFMAFNALVSVSKR